MRLPRPPAATMLPWVAAAIVALAVVLRAARIANGLPEFVEEAAPFRWALEMWSHAGGRIDWNPHHFIYPSLTIYLHLLLQRTHALVGTWTGAFHGPADWLVAVRLDPTPMVMLARALDIAADAASVWLTFRIGERVRPGAGIVAALLVALSPIAITTSSAIFTDPVMLALSLAALDRVQAYVTEPRATAPWAMAVWTGLAIGAKYPAVMLLVPLAWTLLRAHGARAGLVRLGMAIAIAALVFLATSPYVLIDRAAFVRDVSFGRVLASEGLLGATAGPSGWHTLGTLVADMGPVAFALALAGLALAFAPPRGAAAPVALAMLAFLVPVLASPLQFDRYLLGVIPTACVLAGLAAMALVPRVPVRMRARVLAAALLAALLPVAVRAGFTARTGATTTEAQARRWIERRVTRNQLVLVEPYGPWLRTRTQAAADADLPFLAEASPALRARWLARPWWSAVRLPALVAGTIAVRVQPRSGPAENVTVFEHASDFNRVVYDTRLLRGVDCVVTTDAMRARFEADTVRYAVPCAFYRYLDAYGAPPVRFASSPSASGPGIAIYALSSIPDPPATATLGRWWWAERIPEAFRRRADALLAPGFASTGAVEAAPGVPSPWVVAARELYDTQLRSFAEDLALNLLALDRPFAARSLMDAEQAIAPESQLACLLHMEASRSLGDWPGARAAFERTAAVIPASAIDSSLVAGYAEALEHTGAPARAGALRDSLARRAQR